MRAMRNSSLGFALALLAAIGFAGCSKTGQSSSQPNFTQQPGSSSAPAATSSAAQDSSSSSAAAPGPFQAPAQSQQSSAQPAPAPQPIAITLPTGTRLNVVLDQTISSATARAGDTFGATLVDPVRAQGQAVIPQNARVSGHVVAARASGRLSGVAELVLTLDSVRVGGNSYNIRTSTISRRGSSHKKRDIIAIGGGSALGAIIGGIAGGGKGAAIGAVAGGGAGTAGAAITGKKNVALPAEASLIFRLEAPLTIQ